MFKFILSKITLLIPTFLGITLAAFLFVRLLPGDPVTILSGERGISDERRAEMIAQFGLDKPVLVQYLNYLKNLVQGDFGQSISTHRPVVEEFFERLPATMELAFFAILIAVLVGVPAGIIAAVKRGRWPDHVLMGSALTGYSMPIFWWGLLLIMLFSTTLGWTPVSGRLDIINYYFEPVTGFMTVDAWLSGQEGAVTSALHHLILPSVVLSTIPMAVIARQTRSAMLEVLGEDYIRTAYAKGLPTWRVIGIHALRNAMIIVVTVIGLEVGTLLAGAVLTESIFSWPGVGKWMIDAISHRDYPAVQGGLLFISMLVMLVNLIVDLMYGWINPRVRDGK
ncbi:ABC transporter permease [Thiolinea disciformis]|uniref:ABC transporter permease n=1 Tax=Thiolinea disciformis TaxID=125614 RepID=UPI00037BB19B|nr:ABC transporter permease subunit [Thiolinea disciformis]